MPARTNYHPCIIPALDILISDPDILYPKKTDKKKADYLCIPLQYLDKLSSYRSEYNTTRGDSARQVVGAFGMMLEKIHATGSPHYICENGMHVEFFSDYHDTTSTRTSAILLAHRLQQSQSGSVAIMTGDDSMIAKASNANVDIARVNPEIYTGRRKVVLPTDAINLWERNHKITAEEWNDIFGKRHALRANEFVELQYHYTGQTQGYKNIGRFDANRGELIPLRYIKFHSPAYNAIRPLNAIQAMILEALLAPVDEIPIVIISGVFGIGKTFLPIAAGLNGVGYRNSSPNIDIERVFVCPRDSSLGRDIGFRPGDTTAKTLPKAMPVIDNIRAILKLLGPNGTSENSDFSHDAPHKSSKKRYKKGYPANPHSNSSLNSEIEMILERYFEFVPMIDIGGRSIEDALIIYDEFQDVERRQARELFSRLGSGSKMVIAGDSSQRTNPHVNRTSNGLNYAATRLSDKSFAAVISSYEPDEIVRHWVLSEIAKAFGVYH